ncbi:MAG: hypothetical protein ACYC96_02145 [Fimbriimonadaceae bacterium]
MLTFLFPSQLHQAPPRVSGWTYVASAPIVLPRLAALRPLSWDQLKASGPPADGFVVRNNMGFAFDESVWQSLRMAAQISLYEALERRARGGSPQPPLVDFAQNGVAAAGRRPSTHCTVELRVERTFTLMHLGSKVTVLLSNRPASVSAARRLGAVADAEPAAGMPARPAWVHYPTAYGYLSEGDAGTTAAKKFDAMRTAIDLLDEHVEAFMAVRATRLAAIETAVDSIDPGAIEGRSVKRLDPGFVARLQTAAASAGIPGNRDPVATRAWVLESSVEDIKTKLYVQAQDGTGERVDIEAP